MGNFPYFSIVTLTIVPIFPYVFHIFNMFHQLSSAQRRQVCRLHLEALQDQGLLSRNVGLRRV